MSEHQNKKKDPKNSNVDPIIAYMEAKLNPIFNELKDINKGMEAIKTTIDQKTGNVSILSRS